MDIKKIKKTAGAILLTTLLVSSLPAYSFGKKDDIIIPENYPEKYDVEYVKQIKNLYKDVREFSRRAIMGNNLSKKPVRIMFKDLSTIRPDYADYDALGWKKGGRLYIFINPKHKEAPPGAIAALLSHEALHQDEYNSIAEETYAWTMEASVWSEIVELYPESDENLSPLVTRENTLKKLFEKGNYSSKYIRKTVQSNEGYKGLPATSPGFEDL